MHYYASLLEGLDGGKKMSKSENNYIGITESADEIFGKTMSIPDEIMIKWFNLLSMKTPAEVSKLEKKLEDGSNPRDIKIELAMELASRYTDENKANEARENFIKKFSSKELPSNIELITLSFSEIPSLPNLLKDIGFTKSTSEGIRLISQGAVKIDEVKVDSKEMQLKFGNKYLLQVGKKRFTYIMLQRK